MVNVVKYEVITLSNHYQDLSAEMLVIPAVDGDMGVQDRLSDFVAEVKRGIVYGFNGGRVVSHLMIDEGFAYFSDNKLKLVVNDAYLMDDLTVEKINEKISALKEKLRYAETDISIVSIQKSIEFFDSMLSLIGNYSYK